MTTARSNRKSIPTIPKAAVKIRSRYVLAKVENGPTQPIFWLAVKLSGHVLSTMKGGVMELR